jgi:adenosylmethionine-8-amino-7-oxononanoate aminotransferase
MPAPSRVDDLLRRTFVDFIPGEELLRDPLIFSRADGLYLWDAAGRRYFDAIGGVFVAVLGHRHPRVMDAMRRQMDRMTFAPPLHGIADVTLDFVEKLGAVTPPGLTYVKPYSGGSEAVEAALKFTRQYFKQTGRPGKYKFISRYNSYHGATFGGTAASGCATRKTVFEPLMSGFLKVAPPSAYRDRFPTWEEANRFAARAFEDVIVNEDPATVAGIIVEPIGNTGGIITPTEEYFRILREICDRYAVMLIYDEVITGFGKTGSMFAAQTYGVAPDIICAGKGISSGAMPLGAMIARQDFAETFWGDAFAHGHTFAGNPLACAAGIAVVDELVERRLPEKARRLGAYLFERLEALRKFGIVREVRGKGILLGVEVEPIEGFGQAMKRCALENGLILRIDPTWFAVAPPLIAEERDIDEMMALIEETLAGALRLVGR